MKSILTLTCEDFRGIIDTCCSPCHDNEKEFGYPIEVYDYSTTSSIVPLCLVKLCCGIKRHDKYHEGQQFLLRGLIAKKVKEAEQKLGNKGDKDGRTT